MSKSLKMLVAGFALITCVNMAHAGKLKSSESYLKKVEAAAISLNESMGELKAILDSNNKNGSFVTTDFLGFKPKWYFKNHVNISTRNPFWEDMDTREISGVVFTKARRIRGIPRSVKNEGSWREYINISLSFMPGASKLDYYKNNVVMKYFTDNGVIDEHKAFNEFSNNTDPLIDIIENSLFQHVDKILAENTIHGDKSDYKYLAKKERRMDVLSNPSVFYEFFTQDLFKQYDAKLSVESIYELYNKMYSDDEKTLENYYMYDGEGYFSISIEASRTYFVIANGMSKSQKYNQTNKLRTILDNKVKDGKAVTKKYSGFIVYEDATGNGLYKGAVGIDYEKGIGFWQLPIVSAKADVLKYKKRIKDESKKLNVAIKRYLELLMAETSKKSVKKGVAASDF